MLDYDREAAGYDASRGGEARAVAAAGAVERLLPEDTRVLLDVACGTGIVTRRLTRPGRRVVGVDRSQGMAAVASTRLSGAVALGDGARLPVGSARADAVVVVWLLHLLDDAAPVLAEAARVLRAGGVLITTVDKNQAAFAVDSDVAAVTAAVRSAYVPKGPDHVDRVVASAAGHGLRVVGETTFAGIGQGRSPRQWRERILEGRIPWARAADPARIADELASLPDQEVARPDPLYRLIALA
ncbi:class I SAM-dependent methyltransferase [Actinoallomurus sp. NPDC050550]|uniref:class I SAM-dependent methyltransferase n=1 Tax=Actinoallomurus sp. NPDC050550 TaxID=3154937 RepID=UPI0033C723F1